MGGGVSVEKSTARRNGSNPNPFHLSAYEFQRTIGEGSFASVRVAEFKYSKLLMALKELKLTEGNPERKARSFFTEVAVLRRLNPHPNLPVIYTAFSSGLSCFLGQSLATGGDFRYYLRSGATFTIEQVAYMIYSTGAAIHHLHDHNILHKDIKPENIVLTANGVPILTDFGISHVEEYGCIIMSMNSSGTKEYLAPEVLTPSHRHGIHSDFWSLGVVAYELLFRHRPFSDHCWKSMIYSVENHYGLLWDRVEHEQHCTSVSSNIDWIELARCAESERVSSMRYPTHDIPFQEDGSLPQELVVPIPPVTSRGELINSECAHFVTQLLDVRIPLRLGAGPQYEAFTGHPFFATYNIAENIRNNQPSPFIPDVKEVEHYLNSKYGEKDFVDSMYVVVEDDVTLPEQLQMKLNTIKYASFPITGIETDETSLVEGGLEE